MPSIKIIMQLICQISLTLDHATPNTNMSAAQNTHVSGANALDLGSVSEANQNITPDIKTNYREIQENVKTRDPAIEDFLRMNKV